MIDTAKLFACILRAVADTAVLAKADIEWLARFLKRTDPRIKPVDMLNQLYDLCDAYNRDKASLSAMQDYRAHQSILLVFNHLRQTAFAQPNILVAVPQRKRVRPENEPPPNLAGFVVPQPLQVQAATCFGFGHAEARNFFVDKALKEGRWTHVLFADDDNLIPLDFLTKALKTKLPIVGAMYLKKTAVPESIATEVIPDERDIYQQYSVDPANGDCEPRAVNCTGLGCTLVSVEALRRIKANRGNEPVFHWVWDENNPDPAAGPMVGEDSQFCRDALAVGIQPYVLPGVVSPHCSFEESKKAGKPVFYGPAWVVDPKTRDIRPELKDHYTKFVCNPGDLYAPDNLNSDGRDVFGKSAVGR